MKSLFGPVPLPQYTLVADTIPDIAPVKDRAPGIHVAECRDRLLLKWGVLKKAYGPIEPKDMIRLKLGAAFEYAMLSMFIAEDPNGSMVPGEIERDELFGNPDWYKIEEDRVSELKATWKSSDTHRPGTVSFLSYEIQLMAYCYMMRTRKGCIHVAYINGPGFGAPEYRKWHVEYTDVQLKYIWSLLQICRKEILREQGMSVH